MSLLSRLHGRVTVVGVGNPMRGDDGAGCRIARALHHACASSPAPRTPDAALTIIDAEEVPESFLGPVVASRPDVVLLVDAVDLGAEPGASALLEAGDLTDGALFTHRTPLAPLAAYIHNLTGAHILLLAIQPACLDWGAPLSAPVAATVDDLTLLLREAWSC
ncbi:MAG TPA: hydrogenase maturation protease [Longimicrobiales bacterium]|nr:hydrogenase maturation protease [Longimicrobiales bacterium]